MSSRQRRIATKENQKHPNAIKYQDWLDRRFKEDPKNVIEHLNAMLAAPDEPELFLSGLGDVARSHGIAELADETGLNRENLYQMLSNAGNPRFSSLLKVIDSLGLRLMVQHKAGKKKKPAG